MMLFILTMAYFLDFFAVKVQCQGRRLVPASSCGGFGRILVLKAVMKGGFFLSIETQLWHFSQIFITINFSWAD